MDQPIEGPSPTSPSGFSKTVSATKHFLTSSYQKYCPDKETIGCAVMFVASVWAFPAASTIVTAALEVA